MEPSSVRERTKSPGKLGSIDNPEVVQDVPGHVIPILEREFDDFDTESSRFLRWRLSRERVHRLPAETGRLRPAPAGRPDVPREAAVGRRHARADGDVRRRGGEVRAAQKGSRHDPAERPDPPHPARPDGAPDPRHQRRRPVDARRLRQHGPQRHGRSLGGDLRGRGLRHDAVGGRLRALLRPSPDDAADAAQGQDRLRRHPGRPRDHRHPRHRLPRECATASRASRSASAAARRSWRASRRRSTTSSRPRTAST